VRNRVACLVNTQPGLDHNRICRCRRMWQSPALDRKCDGPMEGRASDLDQAEAQQVQTIFIVAALGWIDRRNGAFWSGAAVSFAERCFAYLE
jgi:hypothetical protein